MEHHVYTHSVMFIVLRCLPDNVNSSSKLRIVQNVITDFPTTVSSDNLHRTEIVINESAFQRLHNTHCTELRYRIFLRISRKILGSFSPSKSGDQLICGSENLPPAVVVVASQVNCVNSGRPVGGAWSAVVCET